MAVVRGEGPSDPAGRAQGVEHLELRRARSTLVARGTLACPSCDAPVLPARPTRPAEALTCPFCGHGGALRDFLSLADPTRPARVEIRIRRF